MVRKQLTMKIANPTDEIADKLANRYNLSKSNYIEMIFVLDILNSDYNVTDEELNGFFDALITNKNSTNRKEFRELHKTLPKEAKIQILKFIYNFNMIDNVDYQTRKQANFNKDNQYLFYYSISNMRDTDIDVYVNTLGINIITIGTVTMNSNEYVYLGREQWFKHSSNKSHKFNDICIALGISRSCDCIKIHYKELYKLIPILKSI